MYTVSQSVLHHYDRGLVRVQPGNFEDPVCPVYVHPLLGVLLYVFWIAMAACRGSSSKWFFTREQLETTPSRRCGVEPDRELSYRQQAANLIQDMGQRLNVYPF